MKLLSNYTKKHNIIPRDQGRQWAGRYNVINVPVH